MYIRVGGGGDGDGDGDGIGGQSKVEYISEVT